MIFKDYYKILGLDNNKVSIDEIKIAYREQAKKYHPDVNIGNKNAEERFKDINEAYKVLSDFTSKKKYDRMWNTHIGRKKVNYEESKREKGSIFSDFFNMFFGVSIPKYNVSDPKEKNNFPSKGENIETEIDVSIEEAFYGADKKVSLRTVNGKMKTFTISIPAGIRDKEKMRLIGQGKNGINGGKNGDLFIKINIQDSKKYKLSGYDIYTNLLLTPWEAALGTKVNVETIDEEVSVYIPEGIESGDYVKVPYKGYKNGKGGRGDLIIEAKIMIPKNMTEKEKELFKKLNEISKFNPRNIYC